MCRASGPHPRRWWDFPILMRLRNTARVARPSGPPGLSRCYMFLSSFRRDPPLCGGESHGDHARMANPVPMVASTTIHITSLLPFIPVGGQKNWMEFAICWYVGARRPKSEAGKAWKTIL